ncbi:MAG: hypothetical protein WAK53_03325 [Chromatiaceae bacterium]
MSSQPLLAGGAATTVAPLPAGDPRPAHRISASPDPALWKTSRTDLPVRIAVL